MTKFPLPVLCDEIRRAALELSGQEVEPLLVSARLMDGLRDARVPLPGADAWNEKSGALLADEWARVEILVRMFRESSVAAAVAECLREDATRALRAFPEIVTSEAKLLTVELLLKSTFRVEELARKWVMVLGGAIEGESAAESERQAERLDFGGVLKNLRAAESDRETRMKKLKALEEKRLKEQQDAYARAGRE